ncbi:hypothetical protein PO909_032822 [Leuciscus waleckii]
MSNNTMMEENHVIEDRAERMESSFHGDVIATPGDAVCTFPPHLCPSINTHRGHFFSVWSYETARTSEIQLFPSDDESLLSQDPTPQSSDVRSIRAPPDIIEESPEPLRGRRPLRTSSRTPLLRGLPSPPPASPASSYASAHPTTPAIERWTVVSLRQALISADVHFSRRLTKAQLYDLYVSLQPICPSPKSTSPSKITNKASTNRKAPSSSSQKAPSRTRPSLPRAPGRIAGLQLAWVGPQILRLLGLSLLFLPHSYEPQLSPARRIHQLFQHPSIQGVRLR